MATEIEIFRAALKTSPAMHDKLRGLALSGKLGPLTEVPDDAELTVVAAPDHFGIEGTKQDKCACGAVVWLSPSTQEMLLKRGATPTLIICVMCMVKRLRERHDVKTGIQ